MKLFDLISMTFRNLLRRKARTLLTMTGVVVGTCAIVVMISLGLAMTQAMEESLAQMGDLTQITIQNYGSSQDLKLNDEVVSKVQKLEGVVAVTPMASASNLNMMAYAGRNDRYQMYLYNVMGVYPEALPYFGYQVQEGEMLTSSPAPKKTAYMMFGGESAYEFEDSKRSWRNNRVYATPDENGKMPDPFVDPMNDKITLRLQAREFDENGKPLAIVFKTIADQYGRFSYFKVMNGDLTSCGSWKRNTSGLTRFATTKTATTITDWKTTSRSRSRCRTSTWCRRWTRRSKKWVLKPTLWIRCASRCRSRCSSNSCFWAAWLLSLSWLLPSVSPTQ